MRFGHWRGVTLAITLGSVVATGTARADWFHHAIPKETLARDYRTGDVMYAPPIPYGEYVKDYHGAVHGAAGLVAGAPGGLLHGELGGLLGGGHGGHGHGDGCGDAGCGDAGCGDDGCGDGSGHRGWLGGGHGWGRKHGGRGLLGHGHKAGRGGQDFPFLVHPSSQQPIQASAQDACGRCGGKGCGLCGGKLGRRGSACGGCGGTGWLHGGRSACGPCGGRGWLGHGGAGACDSCGGKGCGLCGGLAGKAHGLLGLPHAAIGTLLHKGDIQYFVGPGGPVPITPGYVNYVVPTRSPRDYFAFPPYSDQLP